MPCWRRERPARTLKDHLRRPCGLGWVKTGGLCTAFEGELVEARRAFEQGRVESGRQILKALLPEVDVRRGGRLEEEAYLILRHNVLCILNQR